MNTDELDLCASVLSILSPIAGRPPSGSLRTQRPQHRRGQRQGDGLKRARLRHRLVRAAARRGRHDHRRLQHQDRGPDGTFAKRYRPHLDSFLDPDPYGPPVLYWFRTVRNPKAPGGAEFVPELIRNRSGAGSDILAVDLNGGGAMDIITSTDRGTFIFRGKPNAKQKFKATDGPR